MTHTTDTVSLLQPTRYDFSYSNDFNDRYPADRDEDADGEYVRLEDVQCAIDYWNQRAAPVAATQPAGDMIDCPKCLGSSIKGEVRGVRCSNCNGLSYLTPAASAPAQPAAIPIPQNADGAALMLNLAHEWLMEYAPERLRQGGPVPPMPAQPEAKGEAPHWLDSPQSALNGKTAREGYAANPEYAHLFADEPNLWKRLANRAVEVLNRHIVPDGVSDNDALIELYGIFDGPEYRAALAAPVPAAPADDSDPIGEMQADARQAKLDDFVSAAPADKGELPEPDHRIERLDGNKFRWIDYYTAESVRACILADRARQTAIAQPSGAVSECDLRAALTAVDAQLVTILNGADGSVYSKLKAARNDLVRIWLPLAAAPQPPSTGVLHTQLGPVTPKHGIAPSIGHWNDGTKPVDWTPEAVAELHAVLNEYPPEPRTGSIADDAEFRFFIGAFGKAVQSGIVKDAEQASKAIIAYIDTRTAALIDAASKERGVDAEARERNLELVITRLEQIAGNFSTNYREDAEQALVCARAIATMKAAK